MWFDIDALSVCYNEVRSCLQVSDAVFDESPMERAWIVIETHERVYCKRNIWTSSVGNMVEHSCRLPIILVLHKFSIRQRNWDWLGIVEINIWRERRVLWVGILHSECMSSLQDQGLLMDRD